MCTGSNRNDAVRRALAIDRTCLTSIPEHGLIRLSLIK